MTADPHGLVLDVAVQDLLDRLHGQDAPLTPDATAEVGERWLTIDAGELGPLRLWIVTPRRIKNPRGTVVYLHGGGWVTGGVATHRRLVRELAERCGAAVVFPEYSLAPGARCPIALHQAYAATRWVAAAGAEAGLDVDRIALAGDSEGATLAIGVTLLALRHKTIGLRQLVAVTPATAADFDTPSYRMFAEGYGLRRDTMRWRWDQYAPDVRLRRDITVSPLLAGDAELAEFPPTLILTAEADVLRDDGEAFAAKLRAAGAVSTAVRYEGTIHGFVVLDALRNTPAARAAVAQTASVLAGALGPGASTSER